MREGRRLNGNELLGRLDMHLNGVDFQLTYRPSYLGKMMIREVYVDRVYPHLPFLTDLRGDIVDVGANVGATAMLLSIWFPNKRIICCEPCRDTFKLLETNAAQRSNIRVANVGLSDKTGDAVIYRGDESVQDSLWKCDGLHKTKTRVRLVNVREFLKQQAVKHISILKLDTEGCEVPILRALKGAFSDIDAIFVEYHSEGDRVEIDRMLSERYLVYKSHATMPHLGVVSYVKKQLIATATKWNAMAITRTTRKTTCRKTSSS